MSTSISAPCEGRTFESRSTPCPGWKVPIPNQSHCGKTLSGQKHHKSLTPGEARRALYIDFEGQKVGPPVLLGCTRRSKIRTNLTVWQAVTDPRFDPIARAT